MLQITAVGVGVGGVVDVDVVVAADDGVVPVVSAVAAAVDIVAAVAAAPADCYRYRG